MTIARSVICCFAVALAACGGDSGGGTDDPDGAAGADAAVDGGSVDAAAPSDAGPPDAAPPRTMRVSVSSSGAQAIGVSGDLPTISGDGRLVVFTSDAANLVDGDDNALYDTFLHDMVTGETSRLSEAQDGSDANLGSSTGWISRNGRFVCLSSSSTNLIPNDGNNANDVFLLDRDTGVFERVSVSSTEVAGNAGSWCGGVSDDGRFVVFYSAATNLAGSDGNGNYDAFVRDRQLGTTTLASATAGGSSSNDITIGSAIAPDGAFVVFSSRGSNIVAGDTNDAYDIFLRPSDGSTPATLISRTPGGAAGNGASNVPSVSGDGRLVAFLSSASDLVPGDENGQNDVFVHDVESGVTTRVSLGQDGEEANGHSENPKLSHDGRYLLFVSTADNLVPGDTNGQQDAFVTDRQTGMTVRVSVGDQGQEGLGRTYYASLSDDGTTAVFTSSAANLVAGDTNGEIDVFVHHIAWPLAVP